MLYASCHHVQRVSVGPVEHHEADAKAGHGEFWSRKVTFEFDTPYAGAPKRFELPLFSDVKDGLRMPGDPEPPADPPLVARIAGPGVSDLADLEVPPLSEVDPEAVFPGAGDLPRIGTDATKHDVRGACR
jgi:hypothetical protein